LQKQILRRSAPQNDIAENFDTLLALKRALRSRPRMILRTSSPSERLLGKAKVRIQGFIDPRLIARSGLLGLSLEALEKMAERQLSSEMSDASLIM
jgi:hypothetical protein